MGGLWLLSALFAAPAILAKIGIDGVNSNLATAIRTIVILVMAWGIVFFTGSHTGMKDISHRSMLFLILSGAATGLSWLCYFRAIQLGDVSKVVPIDKHSVVFTIVIAFVFLHEQVGVKSILGMILIGMGTLVLVFIKEKSRLFMIGGFL